MILGIPAPSGRGECQHLFQSFPGIFFELLDRPPQEAQAYQFSSVEIKQLAFRIDGVFLPSADTPEQPIYFAEAQFQGDSFPK